jgi:Tol biopolymer transport system component
MKGTLRFLSLSIRWTTLSVCCAFAISGLSHLSAFSHYRSDLARQSPNYQATIHRAKAADPFQRMRSGSVDQSDHAAFDLWVLPAPQAGSSKIVFTSNRDGSMQIYVMNSDGTGQTRLTYSGANDDYPRWSPNGAKILFQSDRANPFTGYMDIYVMNSDGSGVTRLTTDASDDSMATWSPDGSKIVFQSMRNGLNYQVYLMNADGSNQICLTNTSSSDGEPSWSPDGTNIVFASDRDHAGFDSIYVMNSNGSNQQRTTFSSGDVEDTQPVWSRDGSKIAFVSTRDSIIETWQETDDDGHVITKSRQHINKEVYLMNADGSGQTRLTNDLGNDDSPSWSPDGSKIVFRSDRERDCCDPTAQIWTMNANGTGQANISNTGNGDYGASWSSNANQPPVANAGGAYSGFIAQAVNLNSSGSFDPDGTITSYSWNFGDGVSASGVTSMHTYTAAGTYTVTLTVTDNFGLQSSGSTTATITGSSNGQSTTGDGSSSSPDATARPATINFDTLQTNIALPANQYQMASFSSSTGGTIYTQYDCGFGGSCPNGIVATSGSGNNYWPTADIHVNFAIPVNGLMFRVLGSQAGGSSGYVDVYVNNSFSQSIYFFSGAGGGPGQIYPPFVVNLSWIPHVTGIVIRDVRNYDYWYASDLLLYYDDFTFTPELSANITNPRVSGGLDQTTKYALAGANIVLQSSVSTSGGSYSWSLTGPSYSVTSGSLTSSSITIRPTDTGTMTSKLTYTLNGVSVSPTATINVITPTLTYFGGQEAPDQVNRDANCSSIFPGTTYSLGCRQPGRDDGMVWTATAQIPSVDYLSDPAESGVKFVQAVNVFRKKLTNGNTDCYTARLLENDQEAWQKDNVDPFMHPIHPIHYFSGGSRTIGMAEHDAPAAFLEGTANGHFFSDDVNFVDDKFETYVFYFTTNPSAPDPGNPIFQRPIGLQGSSYPYAAMKWSWGGTVTFNFFSTPRDVLYTVQSNTLIGPVSAVGVNELKSLATNAKDNQWLPCWGFDQTSNPIDSSRFYVNDLYYDFLQRGPDEDGWNFWRSNITSCGFSQSCIRNKRVDVARAFFYSTEFIGHHPALASDQRGTHDYSAGFVFACYFGFLRRAPNDPPDNNWDGFNFWVNKLDSTNPDASDGKYNEMLKAFIESTEFRNRFVGQSF